MYIPMIVLDYTDFTIKGNITWLNSWFPLTVFAVMVSIVVHISLLMIGKAFQVKELENYAESEMLQAAATAVMAGFLIVMVNSAMDIGHSFIAGDVACGSTPVHIGASTATEDTMQQAFDAIRCRIQQKAVSVADVQESIETDPSTFNDFNLMNTQGSILGITVFNGNWIDSLYSSTETKRIINNLATVLLIGLDALSSIISYVEANMLTMFIPLGVLMRSFYFTRGVGALFIAFGIGMYFLFPVFFVLLDPGFTPAPPQPPAVASTSQPYCYPTMSSTVSTLKTLQAGGLGTTEKLGDASIRDDLSKAYIDLLLHPLVAFFMTMIFVRYMMTVLGADTFEVMRMVTKVV